MDEIRSQIHAAFEKEQAANPAAPSLRRSIVQAVAAREPGRETGPQWLAVAAAVILGVLLVGVLMSTRLTHGVMVPAAPATSPSSSASPSPSQPAPSPSPMTVAAADAQVRSTVTGAHPLLLPTGIPEDWSAVVTNLSPSFFTVTYTSPDGTKSLDFAIEVANPGPPGPNGTQSNPKFHGDGHSLYQVDDATVATSHRFLMWNEPGTWSEPNGLPGVPYFMASTGLTDAEFRAIADSVSA